MPLMRVSSLLDGFAASPRPKMPYSSVAALFPFDASTGAVGICLIGIGPKSYSGLKSLQWRLQFLLSNLGPIEFLGNTETQPSTSGRSIGGPI